MKTWNPNFITRVVTTLAIMPIAFGTPAPAAPDFAEVAQAEVVYEVEQVTNQVNNVIKNAIN